MGKEGGGSNIYHQFPNILKFLHRRLITRIMNKDNRDLVVEVCHKFEYAYIVICISLQYQQITLTFNKSFLSLVNVNL
jgi:hypothetical protein